MPTRSIARRIADVVLRAADRIRAKLAFHRPRDYRSLIERAWQLAGAPSPSEATIRLVRRLDPAGLGVWYLARRGTAPRLTDRCRRAIATPAVGPPLPVAKLLHRSLLGEPVCWFGEPRGFDALCAENFVLCGVTAALSAIELLWHDGTPPWLPVMQNLTLTANAAQSAVRARRRVYEALLPSAEDATRLAYQSVNTVRRALNRTDLTAADDQLAREAAQLALAAGDRACQTVIALTTHTREQTQDADAFDSHQKLAAMARSVDALIARVAIAARSDALPPATRDFLLDQASRVVHDAPKALRPWAIHILPAPLLTSAQNARIICERASNLAEQSSEVLEAWATLHELLAPPHDDSRTADPPQHAWPSTLVRATTGQVRGQEVHDAIRNLTGPTDRAVAAAVCLAALPTSSLRLAPDLWKLIRDAHSTDLEKSLAFELFRRWPHRLPE